jgi:hypothetical protein
MHAPDELCTMDLARAELAALRARLKRCEEANP